MRDDGPSVMSPSDTSSSFSRAKRKGAQKRCELNEWGCSQHTVLGPFAAEDES